MILAVIFAIGTEGACVTSLIGFAQAVVQELIAIIVMIVSYRLIKLEDARELNRMVY